MNTKSWNMHNYYHVYYFSDAFMRERNQPGDFVKFYNLHAMKHKITAPEEQHSAVPIVELCLHGGTSYGRGMRIFDETDKQVLFTVTVNFSCNSHL